MTKRGLRMLQKEGNMPYKAIKKFVTIITV